MFKSNDSEKYLGIDEAMKNIAPIPLSPRQRAAVVKLTPYPFILIGTIYLMFLIVPLVSKGGSDLLGFMIVMATIIAGLVLLLVLKDKLKMKSFERVYIVRGFVENRIRVRGGHMLRMRYHDFLRNEIKVITRTEPSDLMFQKNVAVAGRGIELIMGEKNGKLSYVAVKTPKMDI